jgi:hypothetical protein
VAREVAGFPAAFRPFPASNSFNNATTLSSSHTRSSYNSTAAALGGLVVATLVLGLCIGIFALVSNGGHIRTPAFIEDIAAMLSPPAPPPPVRKASTATASQNPSVDPGNRAGPSAAAPGADAASGAASHDASAPKTAAQALQQILHQYRNDPKHTATVTITSTGRIVQSGPGPLTAHDGLPVDSVNSSVEFQGSGAIASGAARAP